MNKINLLSLLVDRSLTQERTLKQFTHLSNSAAKTGAKENAEVWLDLPEYLSYPRSMVLGAE